jgi:hypothetical protein
VFIMNRACKASVICLAALGLVTAIPLVAVAQPVAEPGAAPVPAGLPRAAPRQGLVVLYDGSLGTGTPDKQGFSYLTRAVTPPLLAAQRFADGVTTLTTTLQTSDMAGYIARADRLPALDRSKGFVVVFSVQVAAEEHAGSDKNGDGVGDRAGFSLIVLSSDTRGIELAFWPDEIWAQNDGAAEPPPNDNTLFTHGEGVRFDATQMTDYVLMVKGEAYSLLHERQQILSGRLRDYRPYGQFPYILPNFLFLGDDTSTASATIRLAHVGVLVESDGVPVTPTPKPSPAFLPFATLRHRAQ